MSGVEVIKSLNTLAKIAKFLESNSVVDVLASVELASARRAFSEINSAVDKRGQVWNCIGHLGTCYEAHRHIYRGATKPLENILVSQGQRLLRAKTIARFSLCLIAVCYAYLGERALCLKYLEMTEKEGKDCDVLEDRGFVNRVVQEVYVGFGVAFLELGALKLSEVVLGKKEVIDYTISDDDVTVIKSQLTNLL